MPFFPPGLVVEHWLSAGCVLRIDCSGDVVFVRTVVSLLGFPLLSVVGKMSGRKVGLLLRLTKVFITIGVNIINKGQAPNYRRHTLWSHPRLIRIMAN